MAFQRVDIRTYRNLEDGAVDTGAAFVFLVGKNGQGKTNFLDAVYTLCYGCSFRGASDAESARSGCEGYSLTGSGNVYGATSDTVVRFEHGKKSIARDGKAVGDRKALVEANPAIVFCHEDMEFAKGEPERRRFFFDQTAGLVSSGYIDALRHYRRALKARNFALKERRLDILEVLDEQIVEYGLPLMETRVRIVREFDKPFSERYEKVSLLGSRVGVTYRPSWHAETGREGILEHIRSRRDGELALKTTMSGPHRDRYAFAGEDGHDFSGKASTGQLRLLSLTLRQAQAEYHTSMTGRPPILLLDDVLLELDHEKRRRFMEGLPRSEQAFFTFLPGEPYGDYASGNTAIYWLDHGRFTNTQGV